MPSIGGVNVFGTSVTMSTADNPREVQINSYFGLSGLEMLDGGLRGRCTIVAGLLHGTSAAALNSAETVFRSYNDGVARTLVDNFGTAWPSVKLESFRPLGRVIQSSYSSYYRPYQARFLHLA